MSAPTKPNPALVDKTAAAIAKADAGAHPLFDHYRTLAAAAVAAVAEYIQEGR